MKTKMSQPILRFGILEAIYWSITASFGSYVVPFAIFKGYAQSHVSVMVAVYLVSAFAGQFIWGNVCDKHRTNKKVFLLGVFLAACAQMAMYFVGSELLFGILYGIFGFTIGPMGSILDTWMLKSFRNDMKAYGISRGGGSMGYAIAMLVMGAVIQRFGYFTMPLCSTAIAAATILLALSTPDSRFESTNAPISSREIMSIMRIPAYVVLLAVLFCASMSSAPGTNLKITLLRSVGGDVNTQGLDAFIGCTVQFIFFEIAGLLRRFKAQKRLMGGMLTLFVSLLAYRFATTYWTIITGNLIQNISYSLIMTSSREIIADLIDRKYQTTAVAVVDAFYSFLGGAVSMLYAGAMVERMGLKFTNTYTLLLSVIPIVLLFVSWRIPKLQRNAKTV